MAADCQGLCTLPPPPGIIWRKPGFPTLLVTYDVGNDFFFSGHTALAVLGAIEAAHLGPPWVAVIAAAIAPGEMIIVLVLRAHYTLDVVAGALAAFLAADMAERLSPRWMRGYANTPIELKELCVTHNPHASRTQRAETPATVNAPPRGCDGRRVSHDAGYSSPR